MEHLVFSGASRHSSLSPKIYSVSGEKRNEQIALKRGRLASSFQVKGGDFSGWWSGFLEVVGFELGLEGEWNFDRVNGGGRKFWINLKVFSDSSFHQHKDSICHYHKHYAL